MKTIQVIGLALLAGAGLAAVVAWQKVAALRAENEGLRNDLEAAKSQNASATEAQSQKRADRSLRIRCVLRDRHRELEQHHAQGCDRRYASDAEWYRRSRVAASHRKSAGDDPETGRAHDLDGRRYEFRKLSMSLAISIVIRSCSAQNLGCPWFQCRSNRRQSPHTRASSQSLSTPGRHTSDTMGHLRELGHRFQCRRQEA